jgi:hypothetical protein
LYVTIDVSSNSAYCQRVQRSTDADIYLCHVN